MRAIGYARVSTNGQEYGLEAQESRISEWAQEGGHELIGIESDRASGRSTRRRPGLDRCLAELRNGADVLVVAKLDRLSRSALDFAKLVEQSQREGWSLAVLDIGVDMTTPNGRLVAGILAQVAQWERELIGARTKDALAEAKGAGVRLGRRPALPTRVVKRIKREREKGATLAAIADGLNTDGIPTAHGGERWWPATVRTVLRRAG